MGEPQPMSSAPFDGTPILAFWPDTRAWAPAAWMRPEQQYVQHWCRNMKWTPAVEPLCWLPMPPPPPAGKFFGDSHG